MRLCSRAHRRTTVARQGRASVLLLSSVLPLYHARHSHTKALFLPMHLSLQVAAELLHEVAPGELTESLLARETLSNLLSECVLRPTLASLCRPFFLMRTLNNILRPLVAGDAPAFENAAATAGAQRAAHTADAEPPASPAASSVGGQSDDSGSQSNLNSNSNDAEPSPLGQSNATSHDSLGSSRQAQRDDASGSNSNSNGDRRFALRSPTSPAAPGAASSPEAYLSPPPSATLYDIYNQPLPSAPAREQSSSAAREYSVAVSGATVESEHAEYTIEMWLVIGRAGPDAPMNDDFGMREGETNWAVSRRFRDFVTLHSWIKQKHARRARGLHLPSRKVAKADRCVKGRVRACRAALYNVLTLVVHVHCSACVRTSWRSAARRLTTTCRYCRARFFFSAFVDGGTALASSCLGPTLIRSAVPFSPWPGDDFSRSRRFARAD